MSDTATQGTGRPSEFEGATSAKTPEEIRAEQAAMNGQPVTMTPPAQAGPVYTEAQLNAAREEAARVERERLHGQVKGIDSIRQELDQLKADRDAEAAARQAEIDAANAEAEAERVKSMTLTQRMEHHEQEMSQRMETWEQQREQEQALLNKERQFLALEAYKTSKLAVAQDSIIPQLRDLIGGNNEAEIDAAIEDAIARTQSIIGDVQQAQQQQWQGQRGVSTTAPAVGPLENQAQQRPLGKADIDNMSMAEYARHRSQLLPATGRAFRGQ